MKVDSYRANYQKYLNFIQKYKTAINASSGSEVDSNANVENKNITTMAGELFKKEAIGINRLLMINKLTELYGEDIAAEYIRQLDSHEIYKHDETSILPYCVSITMYPFLFEGLEGIGGLSSAPKNLGSFAGAFINLVFAVAAQFAGAVSTPEFLTYMDYFIRMEYGDDYYLHADKSATISQKVRTIDDIITATFQQVVYSLNQPAAARNFQSVFWNIAYFDKPYFHGIFDNFVFPDGTLPQWESVSWLQKRFMKWFNAERLKKILTFPVETMNLLDNGKNYSDQEWKNFTAEMWSEGHSFFVYRSGSIDSLSSCCRLKNEIQNNTFSFTLGAGGVKSGSKGVITINVNRLVQNSTRNGIEISEAVNTQIKKNHMYLIAFNEIIKDNFNARLLGAYDADFISLDSQYLTNGINGFVEGAEFLGIKISPNEQYFKYGESILRPIYEANRAAKTKEVMFNTEFVPSL
jgi:ribonucleoside-triphosphate reductase